MAGFGKLVLETICCFSDTTKVPDPWHGPYNRMLLASQSISCLPVSKDAPPQLASRSRKLAVAKLQQREQNRGVANL
jgi:hypothetical protein